MAGGCDGGGAGLPCDLSGHLQPARSCSCSSSGVTERHCWGRNLPSLQDIKPGTPLRPQMAQATSSSRFIIKRLQVGQQETRPFCVETKFDGERCAQSGGARLGPPSNVARTGRHAAVYMGGCGAADRSWPSVKQPGGRMMVGLATQWLGKEGWVSWLGWVQAPFAERQPTPHIHSGACRIQVHKCADGSLHYYSRRGIEHGGESDYQVLDAMFREQVRGRECWPNTQLHSRAGRPEGA